MPFFGGRSYNHVVRRSDFSKRARNRGSTASPLSLYSSQSRSPSSSSPSSCNCAECQKKRHVGGKRTYGNEKNNCITSYISSNSATLYCPPEHRSTSLNGIWHDFEMQSLDSNFTITRSIVSRYSTIGKTLFFRFHVKGSLSVDDVSVTLSLPPHFKAKVEDQFGIAMVSSEADNMQMFAPLTIKPESFVVHQQALRSGVIYDIFAQGIIEIE